MLRKEVAPRRRATAPITASDRLVSWRRTALGLLVRVCDRAVEVTTWRMGRPAFVDSDDCVEGRSDRRFTARSREPRAESTDRARIRRLNGPGSETPGSRRTLAAARPSDSLERSDPGPMRCRAALRAALCDVGPGAATDRKARLPTPLLNPVDTPASRLGATTPAAERRNAVTPLGRTAKGAILERAWSDSPCTTQDDPEAAIARRTGLTIPDREERNERGRRGSLAVATAEDPRS